MKARKIIVTVRSEDHDVFKTEMENTIESMGLEAMLETLDEPSVLHRVDCIKCGEWSLGSEEHVKLWVGTHQHVGSTLIQIMSSDSNPMASGDSAISDYSTNQLLRRVDALERNINLIRDDFVAHRSHTYEYTSDDRMRFVNLETDVRALIKMWRALIKMWHETEKRIREDSAAAP